MTIFLCGLATLGLGAVFCRFVDEGIGELLCFVGVIALIAGLISL